MNGNDVLTPGFGEESGQKFEVAAAIRSVLKGIGENASREDLVRAVIKELMQNADDARARALTIVFDLRAPPKPDPKQESIRYLRRLMGAALLVSNDAAFKLEPGPADDPEKFVPDFKALCKVAAGHKESQSTATGRFGIGFNCTYFLSDTPLIFSRREVHIFDLLHKSLKKVDGWRFLLDDFSRGSTAGEPERGAIKSVLERCFPAELLGGRSFAELATSGEDFQQTVFRFPLRLPPENDPPPNMWELTFPEFAAAGEARADQSDSAGRADRLCATELLRLMASESTRSLLFLKSLSSVRFGILQNKKIDWMERVEAKDEGAP